MDTQASRKISTGIHGHCNGARIHEMLQYARTRCRTYRAAHRKIRNGRRDFIFGYPRAAAGDGRRVDDDRWGRTVRRQCHRNGRGRREDHDRRLHRRSQREAGLRFRICDDHPQEAQGKGAAHRLQRRPVDSAHVHDARQRAERPRQRSGVHREVPRLREEDSGKRVESGVGLSHRKGGGRSPDAASLRLLGGHLVGGGFQDVLAPVPPPHRRGGQSRPKGEGAAGRADDRVPARLQALDLSVQPVRLRLRGT
mmetsp:Transcript_16102/g.28951  ORF Transcript_16102/g.28951 Transcript_16102/m.28951 type:complete len:253 (+) Transcript_16102:371-1129(+)